MATVQIQPGEFVQSKCAKCKKLTKHIVVGLVDGVPSKVQCVFCKGNHNYKPESVNKPPRKPKIAPKSPEMQDWESDSPKWDESKAVPYRMDGVFKKGDLLMHALFGLGIVRKVVSVQRMQVLFSAGEKLMVCAS